MTKTKTEDRKTVLYIRRVPGSLRDRYKSILADEGRTMTEDILKHMETVVGRRKSGRKEGE